MFQATLQRPQRDRSLPRGLLLACLPIAILLAGFSAQASTYLNHDVAWVLYSSRLMLHGAVFGKDIVAANPPLIWWISMLPSGLAGLLELPLIDTFRLFVLVLAAASLSASDRLLVRASASSAQRVPFIAIGAFLLTIGVSRDYGQREHLAMMLVMPYVLAVATRMEGRALPAMAAFAIGAAAGLGIAFKPYFALVPLLLEVALFWRTRSLKLLGRPEAIGAELAVTAYAVAVLLFAKPWLTEALPDISRVYWAFEQPDSAMLIPIAFNFSAPLIGAALVMRTNPTAQAATLLLAAAGFFGAAAIQGKYYSYHVYPAFAFLVLAFVIGIGGITDRVRGIAIGFAAIVLGLSLRDSALTLLDRSDRGGLGRHIAAMVALVDRRVPAGGSFLAISTHPYPGFPTALYTERRWASASNSDIFLPAVVRLREAGAPPASAQRRFAERKAHEAMLRDISNRPDLVLIDRRPNRHAVGASKFDFLAFYLEDPAFRTAWAHYAPSPSAPPGFAAYVRKRGSSS